MSKNLYSGQNAKRSNKDSARFAKAFENAACRNSKMSLANIVVRIMSGDGCFTYITDLEFAIELDTFNNKRPSNLADLLLTFGFSKDLENKARTPEQNAAFAKMLKHVLKRNPKMTIGEILADVVMGKHYCSYHKDKDLIERMEKFTA